MVYSDDGTWTHQITVARLKALLRPLPDGMLLEVNMVGNLCLLLPNTTGSVHRLMSVGWLDLGGR